MGRQRETLTSQRLILALKVRQDREAEYLIVYNNNPVPVYIRIGSPEIPDETNYDYVAPPNFIYPLPATGREFGIRVGVKGVNSALVTGTTVVEAMWEEAQPPSGGVPIQAASLSVSDLLALVGYSGAQYIGGSAGVDLLLWGGLQVYVSATAGTGQGVLQAEVSNDRVTWNVYGQWAIWPNVPATLTLPRVARYIRVFINTTTIPAERAIAGVASLRAVLEEIQNTSFSPNTTSITKTVNVPALGSQKFYFCT